MPRQTHLYVGRAGQLAVMAEFLLRGYNVAIPEVDVGDDIFVVRDRTQGYSRVQVKTALAIATRVGYSARYTVKLDQLVTLSTPDIWYVFANRLENRWQSFVVISRSELQTLYDEQHIGALNQRGMLSFYFSFSDSAVTCSSQDFSPYLNNWDAWPYVQHDG